MELRQLKYFVAVADTLNFSEAARAVCITQSTLSQQVKALEQELDTQLLERSSHSVALTEAGEELLPLARATLRQADLCLDRLRDLDNMLCGTLNIGVTYTFSPILAETLLEFTRQYPGVRLKIFYRRMSELLDMLRAREIDFALAFRPLEPPADVDSHVLFQNYLAAIVSDTHPLAERKSIPLEELSRWQLALPSYGMQARNALESVLTARPVDLDVRVDLNEVNMLLRLVRESRMVTVLAEASIYGKEGVKAIPLELPQLEMTGCVHTLRDSYHKRSMKEFIRLLSDSTAVRARAAAWL